MPKKKKSTSDETREAVVITSDIHTLTENLERQAHVRLDIIKAKITKERTLEVTFMEWLSNDTTNEVTKKCSNLVHDDLVRAMQALRVHLAIICDYLPPDTSLNTPPDSLPTFSITGFSIGGSGDSEGVTLIGNKKIGAKVLNLVAPFTKFIDEFDPYKYATDLQELIDIAKEEVQLYLTGKCAVKQQELDFDGGEENTQEEAA